MEQSNHNVTIVTRQVGHLNRRLVLNLLHIFELKFPCFRKLIKIFISYNIFLRITFLSKTGVSIVTAPCS